MDAVSPGLEEAVERLYVVFKDYRLVSPLHENEFGPFRAPVTSELRAMTAEELNEPMESALTSWGTLEDFKHVFPRMAELIARQEEGRYDPTIALGCHLEQGKWSDWRREEREAVERFLLSLWEDVLVDRDHRKFGYGGDEPLHIMAAAGMDLKPALLRWQELLETSAGHCLWYKLEGINYRSIEKFFRKGQPGLVSVFETSMETTRTYLNWLTSDGLMSAVERAVVATSDKELALNLSYSCARIEEIRSIVSSLRNR